MQLLVVFGLTIMLSIKLNRVQQLKCSVLYQCHLFYNKKTKSKNHLGLQRSLMQTIQSRLFSPT